MAETSDHKKYFWIIYAIVGIVLIYIYYRFDPSSPSNLFPGCPSKSLLKLSCPGCGSQRALHHLLHLEIREAFSYNPMLVISLPYVLVGFIFEIKSIRRKYPKFRKFFFGRTAILIILGIVIVYWVTRNIFHF